MSVKKTELRLLFSAKKTDVTRDIAPDLLGFSYNDKETNEADEITITLKDPDGKWAGSWAPDGGEIVEAAIISSAVGNLLETAVSVVSDLIGSEIGATDPTLPCGRFYVDSLKTSGSPRVMEIKAVSIPLNTPIRKRLKTKAWEKTTLKDIALSIAKTAGVSLIWDCSENPTYDRQDQKQESDLKFLSRLCKDESLSIKMTDTKIVIFDQLSYEKKQPIKTFILGVSPVISWSFESQQSEKYKSVTITYRDPKKKKRGSVGSHNTKSTSTAANGTNPAVNSYTYTDPDADENGQEYQLKRRATSIEEAKRYAAAKLHELNMRHVTGDMTIVGDVGIVAGVVIAISGFGSFDGNFIVEQAGHSVTGSGYTTSLKLRRVNDKY